MRKTAAIHTIITFSHNLSQHVQISCLKNQHAKNQIVCLAAFFTITVRKDKVKVNHTKIKHIISRNKNISREPNENLVCFWGVIFFLDVSHNISQNVTFWKKMSKRHYFLNRFDILFKKVFIKITYGSVDLFTVSNVIGVIN